MGDIPNEAYSGIPERNLRCYKVSSGLIPDAVEGKNHPEAGRLLHFPGCELPRITLIRSCVGAILEGSRASLQLEREGRTRVLASISALSPPCVHNNPRARLREYGRATPKTREASGGRTEAVAGIARDNPT